MHIPKLPDIVIEPIVRLALAEDLGVAGDVTTDALIPPDMMGRWGLNARKAGVVAGLDAAQLAMRLVDPALKMTIIANDGENVEAGGAIAELEGSAHSMLVAERVVLNFVGRLSGVATLTKAYIDAIQGTKAIIASTRKTTPGHRALEKRAVRLGGGGAHRYGLDDAILIKDNHVAAAGSIGDAIARAKATTSHLMKVEVEVDSLAQLREALPQKPDVVLLDNFSLEDMRTAVEFTKGAAMLEASGGVNLQTVRAIAETGVDVISVGALTHSASTLDIGLDAL